MVSGCTVDAPQHIETIQSTQGDAEPINPSGTLLEQCVARLSSLPRKIWRAIHVTVLVVNIFGMFLLVRMASPTRNNRDNETDDDHSANTERRLSTSRPIFQRKFWYNNFKDLWNPNSFWTPLMTTTAIVYYAFNGIANYNATYGDVESFRTGCPETGRRTQTGALVKLFAASVTTVGIHGHLGSLSGSDSWRREFLRLVEVIVTPLTVLFHFATSIHFEITSGTQVWHEGVGIRYRLARICSCRVSSSSLHNGWFMSTMNPRHLNMMPLPRNLKWYGRLTLLFILVGQYAQAAVLITRRLQVQGSAAVDMGMAFMVISGLVALLHSLVCSLINVEFTMRVPLTPCAEELCRLPECVEFKKTHGLPSRRFEYRLFGIHLTGIPRNVLHLLAGGHLQLILFLHQKFTPITLLSSTIAIRFLWEIVFSTLGNLDGGRMLWNDSTKQGSEKRVSEEDSSTSISNSSPSLESNSWTYAGAVGSLLFHFAIFLVGIVGFCLGLFGILMHLFYLICPFVIMHMESIIETSSWKEWDSSKPCAQLWKDDLEDLLWWF